jgi:hypothetical protein
MRLLKLKNEKETWYFSTYQKAAHWLETSGSNIIRALKVKTKCKGYECEWIEADDVLSKYIDPAYGTHA